MPDLLERDGKRFAKVRFPWGERMWCEIEVGDELSGSGPLANDSAFSSGPRAGTPVRWEELPAYGDVEAVEVNGEPVTNEGGPR